MAPGNTKVRPAQPIHRFVGIDVTEVVDTVAFGHMWNANFPTWQNLLWELDKDSAYATTQKRIDKAHPKLPIKRVKRKVGANTFTDTALMPFGVDGDKTTLSSSDIDDFSKFMQTFILKPSADKATSSLNDTGQGVIADVVLLSSHGYHSGTLVHPDLITQLFNASKAADSGQFGFPGWLIMASCGTLDSPSHESWQKLMNSPTTPLRGALGFQDTCPPEEPSADFLGLFIQLLAKGDTLVNAWKNAVTRKWRSNSWAALVHDDAKGDTIANWTANKLTPVPPGSSILLFNSSNLTGTKLTPPVDAFPVFWTKGTTRITTANAGDPANIMQAGDSATITIQPQPPSTTFPNNNDIIVTLIFIREDYPQNLDITKMFAVTGQTGVGPPTTQHVNSFNHGGDDSYKLTVSGTPTEVTFTLKCTDLTSLHGNGFFFLRVEIFGVPRNFVNSQIMVKK